MQPARACLFVEQLQGGMGDMPVDSMQVDLMLARIRYGRLLKSDPDLRGSPEAAQLEEAMRVSWGLGRAGLGWAAAAWPAMGCE